MIWKVMGVSHRVLEVSWKAFKVSHRDLEESRKGFGGQS